MQKQVTRREFIKRTSKTAVGASLIVSTVNAGLLDETIVEEETKEDSKLKVKESERNKNMKTKNELERQRITPEELVGYCGSYCGKCGICGLNIQVSLRAIQNVIETAGIRKEAEHLGWPLMRDIATHCCKEFEDEVNSFTELAGKFFSSGCRDGCGPPCEIVKCCKDSGFFTCAECSKMNTCDKLGKHYAKVSVNLQEIRKNGVESWAKRQFEEVMDAKRKNFVQAVNEVFDF